MTSIKINSERSIDLQKLIDSKLLIQANSGGGKSYTVRRILEQSHGKVQQIILDPEGEFATLREKYEYILCGKDQDVPAEPRSAGMLAHKLLDLGVSAIIDLYELHPQERKRFVRLFLEAMVNAPKNLWHPVLVVIDEAHTFAPEKGDSEALNAVIGLASLGRKRSFGAILATQRISKLHKDAAAECNNKLIGRTGLDIDRKRAGDEIGFTSKEDLLSLRNLQPGEFYAFGPAISNEVVKITVGDVQTSHPKAGSRFNTKIATPTDTIKKALAQLADLPAEAKKEAETIETLKRDLSVAKRENQVLKNKPPEQVTPPIHVIEKAIKFALDKKRDDDFHWEKKLIGENARLRKVIEMAIKPLNQALEISSPTLAQVSEMKPTSYYVPKMREVNPVQEKVVKNGLIGPFKWGNEQLVNNSLQGKSVTRTSGALRMLKVLVSRYPIKLTRYQLATFSKLSPRSGSFGTYLSTLKTQGLIETEGDLFQASQAGIEHIGEAPNPPQTSEEGIAMWLDNLSGGSRRMFEYLVNSHPNFVSKEELGNAVGMVHTSGSFGTYMSILRSNGIVDVTNQGIKASDNLFI